MFRDASTNKKYIAVAANEAAIAYFMSRKNKNISIQTRLKGSNNRLYREADQNFVLVWAKPIALRCDTRSTCCDQTGAALNLRTSLRCGRTRDNEYDVGMHDVHVAQMCYIPFSESLQI